MHDNLENQPKFLPGKIFFILFLLATGVPVAADSVALAYIGASDSPAYDGARLGLAEANHQGRFLGLAFGLDRYAVDAADKLDPDRYLAVLADLEATALRRLAARMPGRPLLNLGAKEDDLRRECLGHVFHIIPSRAMEREALRQWHSLHPQAAVQARAWHPDFVKYAARDLNKRFREAAGRDMDERAWAGWAGVRLLADASVRGVPEEPAALLQHLQGDPDFDGQKGLDMSFRKTGQLRQPLLLIEAGSIVGEAPVRGVVPGNDYDSLGISDCGR